MPSPIATTTAVHVAAHIVSRKPLTVISSSLSVIDTLKDAHGIETICLGGHYNPRFNALFGYFCEQAAGSLRANILFMSTSTVPGTTAYQQEEVVKVKRALMSAADTKVLLIDSSKFGKTALIRLAALAEFDEVITDSRLASGGRRGPAQGRGASADGRGPATGNERNLPALPGFARGTACATWEIDICRRAFEVWWKSPSLADSLYLLDSGWVVSGFWHGQPVKFGV